jgi:hypothetical protein
MIPEKTWSLISQTPIYVRGSSPSLYWWHGIGMTEPMLLTLLGEFCFNIAPSPEIKKAAMLSQFQAENSGQFGTQKLLDDPDENKFWVLKYAIAPHREKRTYTIQEVLSWIKKRNTNDCQTSS